MLGEVDRVATFAASEVEDAPTWPHQRHQVASQWRGAGSPQIGTGRPLVLLVPGAERIRRGRPAWHPAPPIEPRAATSVPQDPQTLLRPMAPPLAGSRPRTWRGPVQQGP